jgi:hypothetical protein
MTVITITITKRLLLVLLGLTLTGCHYYQVRDQQTGAVYYTDKWVAADGYSGPLHFTDSKGQRVNLRASQVTRLSKDDYLDATATPAEEAGKGAP